MSLTTVEKKISDRIHLLLGGTVLNIEIGDEEIQELIMIAVETVSPYSVDTKYLTYPYSTKINLASEGIKEVLRVMPGVQISSYDEMGSEYVFDFTMWSSVDRVSKDNVLNMMKRKITPDVDIPFQYDEESKNLMLRPGACAGMVTIEGVKEIDSVDDIRDELTLKWVWLYTLALAKEVVGRIRSKVTSSNVPIQLDGPSLLAEAQAEKAKLEQALVSEQNGIVPVLR